MVAFGVGVILSIIWRALLRIVIVVGGAYALTGYVSLPGAVDILIWIVAGGYAILCVIGVFTLIAGLAAAADNAPINGAVRAPRPPRRRTRR